MRKILIGCLSAISLVAPATAAAHDGGTVKHKNEYLRAKVIALGASPGRDIVKYGRRKGDSTVHAYFTTMRRMIAPPPAPAPVVTATVTAPSTTTSTAPVTTSVPSTGGGCTGMSAESGSDGYNAYNPSGGYIGCYQIAPSHFAPGGSCSGLGTDPAGQDQCAANICRTEGAGAWTNASGQNPCGRLGS